MTIIAGDVSEVAWLLVAIVATATLLIGAYLAWKHRKGRPVRRDTERIACVLQASREERKTIFASAPPPPGPPVFEGLRVSNRGEARELGSLPRWWLLMVRPRSEKKVAVALARKGFEVLLPTFQPKRQWPDRTKSAELPVFPGYIFCRFRACDRPVVVSTPHVLSGVRADPHPIPVPDSEIDLLKRTLGSGFHVESWPHVTKWATGQH